MYNNGKCHYANSRPISSLQMKTITLFTLLVLTFFILGACGPTDKEKKEAIAAFIDKDYHFTDTLLSYKIDSSKLQIIFPSAPEYDKWLIEAALVNRFSNSEIYLGSHTKFVDKNRITFDNFSIPRDSISYYNVWLSACPQPDDKLFISQPFSNIRSMWREADSVRGILRPDNYWKELKFVRFNLDVRDTLDEALKMHCDEVMIEEFNVSIPNQK